MSDADSRSNPEQYVTERPEYYCNTCDELTLVTEEMEAEAISEAKSLGVLTRSELSAREGLEALGECCPRPNLSPLGKGIEHADTAPESGGDTDEY